MDTETVSTQETNAAGLEVTLIVVPAGGFEFVTPEGQTLLRVQHGPGGGSALTLFGPNGLPAVFLYGGDYGGDIGVCRPDGSIVIRANSYEAEGAFCVFGKGNDLTFAVPAAKIAAARRQAQDAEAQEESRGN